MITGTFPPTSAFMTWLGGLRRRSQEKTTTGHGVWSKNGSGTFRFQMRNGNSELWGYVTYLVAHRKGSPGDPRWYSSYQL
jgi:hypothetical protein